MKKIFISYSWEHDTKNARKLYKTLSSLSESFDVWMDEKKISAGLTWKPAIRKAIRESDFFIAVLSTGSVEKRGMTNYELYEAIEVLKEFPPSQVYLIPARVEGCISPFGTIATLNYVDLFPDWKAGEKKLLAALGAAPVSKKTFASLARKAPSPYHYRIGLVDIDKGLTHAKRVISQLNKIQNYFLFTLPEMPPFRNKVGVIDGMKNFIVSKVSKSYIAKHRHSDTDFMACITGFPLAFYEGDNILYNYFSGESDHDERFMFLSTDQLKVFTQSAGITFEEGVIYILVGQLVAYFSDAKFHDETRGCAMDFCERRADIIFGFKKRTLCPACNKKLPKGELKNAILALLKWKST